MTRFVLYRFHCANYFIERWLKPMQTRKMDEAKIAGALKGMEKCLGEIETVWLANGEKQFLAGDSISVRIFCDGLVLC